MKKLLLIAIASMFSFWANAAGDTTTVSVQVGAGSKFSAINVLDQITGNYVSATVTSVSVQNNNPEVASVTATTSNAVKVTAIAAGSGTAVVSCHLSYVDPGDGLTKSEDKTIVVAFTVIAAPHGVRLSLAFN